MKKLLLGVCTGNSCRSPMLEALVRQELKKQGKNEKWETLSAGTALVAEAGFPATDHAVTAMRNRGLDISKHRSRFVGPLLGRLPLTVIFCLTRRHKECLLALEPGLAEYCKIICPEADVLDPFGGDEARYESCAQELEALAVKVVSELD